MDRSDSKIHKRNSKVVYPSFGDIYSNPRLLIVFIKSIDSSSCLKFIFLIIFIIFVYSIGYFKGATKLSQTLNTQNNQLDELGLTESEREKLNLETIEHMQGFSEAYPTYQLEEAEEEAQVESQNEEDENDLSTSDDDESETADDSESQESDEEIVQITSDFRDEDLFEDFEAYQNAPFISVPNLKTKYNLPYSLPRKNLWWALKAYEKQYRYSPIKLHVPTIKPNIQLTLEEFHKRFRRPAQPVLFYFENLRNLGFGTKNYTLSQLRQMFPFDEKESTKVVKEFVANGIRKDDEELDLGPGLAAIERDENLAKAGKLRNFPRNLKIKQEAIGKLNIQKPPLVKDMEQFQMPTLWMGTSSSDTRHHGDCCDNFVMMVSGTKMFTLSPTSDWRVFNPHCIGKLKNLCWANVIDPNSPTPLSGSQASSYLKGSNDKSTTMSLEQKVMRYAHKINIEVKSGQILYMPAGWFHHIRNIGPTVMVNWWTKGKESCALTRARASKFY